MNLDQVQLLGIIGAMKTNITLDLPDDIHEQLHRYSDDNGYLSFNTLVRASLSQMTGVVIPELKWGGKRQVPSLDNNVSKSANQDTVLDNQVIELGQDNEDIIEGDLVVEQAVVDGKQSPFDLSLTSSAQDVVRNSRFTPEQPKELEAYERRRELQNNASAKHPMSNTRTSK
jgi:hypothetical protein